MPPNCPSSEDLQEFLDCETESRPALAGHIETCSVCQASLESLTSGTAWALNATPHPGLSAPSSRLIELIHQLASRPQTPPSSPDPTDEAIRFPLPPDASAPLGRLQHYAILERIAAGAQGVLFRAVDTHLQRLVAIKVLRQVMWTSAEGRARFEREARAAAGLNHEHVVRVYQIGHEPNFPPFIVMEFIEGQPLRPLLQGHSIEPREAVGWIRQAASGLAAAHAAGLIHRDLKPSNLLLDGRTRKIRISDFGLALDQSDSTRMTIEGTLAGTPAYMSPEQILQPSRIDKRSDLYSLGVVLYELLTGEVPFRGSVRMTLWQVLHDEPRPPRAWNDRIPRDLEVLCLKALAKDPKSRFASALEFSEELGRWERGEPIRSRPVSRWERAGRWVSRHRLASVLAATSALLLVAITGLSLVAAIRLNRKSEEAARHAAAADAQRNAALTTLQKLVNELQAGFEKDEIDLDQLQRDSLQIALEGLDNLRRLATGDRQADWQTAVALRRMGEILSRLQQFEPAQDCFRSAAAICRSLLESPNPGPEPFQELIATLTAHDSSRQEDPRENAPDPSLLEQAAATARTLNQRYPGHSAQLILGQTLLSEARAKLALLDESPFEPVAQLLQESRVQVEPLLGVNKPETEHSAETIWMAATDLLSQAYFLDQRLDAAESLLRAGIARSQAPSSSTPRTLDRLRIELGMRFRLSQIHTDRGETRAAKGELLRISDLLEPLATRAAGDGQFFAHALELHESLGDDRDSEGDLESILFFCEQRRRLIASRLQQVPDDEFAQSAAAVCWSQLAENYELDQRSPKEIRSAFEHALKLFRQLSVHSNFDEIDRSDYLDALLLAAEFELHQGSTAWISLFNEAVQLRAQFPDGDTLLPADWFLDVDSRIEDLRSALADR